MTGGTTTVMNIIVIMVVIELLAIACNTTGTGMVAGFGRGCVLTELVLLFYFQKSEWELKYSCCLHVCFIAIPKQPVLAVKTVHVFNACVE